MMDENSPLPEEIILELPKLTAIVLWAEAIANDRSVEWMAVQWLNKHAKETVQIYDALAAVEARGPSPDAIDTRKERQAMTRTLRLQVMHRDKFTCVYCGAGKEKKLHVDHIVAISAGGKTILANLQTLCFECNYGKAAKPDFKANVVEIGQGRK